MGLKKNVAKSALLIRFVQRKMDFAKLLQYKRMLPSSCPKKFVVFGMTLYENRDDDFP